MGAARNFQVLCKGELPLHFWLFLFHPCLVHGCHLDRTLVLEVKLQFTVL
jgi:hypothetical protein